MSETWSRCWGRPVNGLPSLSHFKHNRINSDELENDSLAQPGPSKKSNNQLWPNTGNVGHLQAMLGQIPTRLGQTQTYVARDGQHQAKRSEARLEIATFGQIRPADDLAERGQSWRKLVNIKLKLANTSLKERSSAKFGRVWPADAKSRIRHWDPCGHEQHNNCEHLG